LPGCKKRGEATKGFCGAYQGRSTRKTGLELTFRPTADRGVNKGTRTGSETKEKNQNGKDWFLSEKLLWNGVKVLVNHEKGGGGKEGVV